MISFKSKKKYHHKIYQRPSLFVRYKYKHRLKSHFEFNERREKKFHSRSFFNNLYRTYHGLCVSVTYIVRFFIFIDRIIRKFVIFIEKLIRIIRIVHGWIKMIKSIFSAIYLIMSRLMMFIFKIYQIFYLLSILFEPFWNRTFEKAVRSFSHFIYEYYSSNGACYTLKARTNHVIGKIRAKWKKNSITINDDDDIYYDALNEEYQ
ncbi:unnamed protein product [Rotaria sp. Silwood2]|nr:unnamed protein product [Rotaria sp. Silwood2]CAF2878501.1 unnamed protein product [Rotaria sp. Silwood2]CAF3047436.1 unnamed protein product [Rotaria sp. Silwood2]CAF4325519.1 unnamed protein product [Rotaria sp. Silwood2]CAF4452293.1 unnamed protein product [Rotaria sp. Silwood2]